MELRRVIIRKEDGTEVDGRYADVKEGDIFRIVEHDGNPVAERPDARGLRWFQAKRAAYPDRDKPGQLILEAYVLGSRPKAIEPKEAV